MAADEIDYRRVPKDDATTELLQECAQLFKDHYGKWSQSDSRAGQPIQLSLERLQEYLSGTTASISTARLDGRLIGYATAVQVKLSHGTVSWVTQFVVHTDYQNRLIGSRILASIWGFSEHYAWGIASANPYAVRALEKATRRRCDPSYILQRSKSVSKVLDQIPYLRHQRVTLEEARSTIDTKFYQDLTSVPDRLERASRKEIWRMGKIGEGEEWLAVTFREQPKLRWTQAEFDEFMSMSNTLAHDAYERMALSDPQSTHRWARPEHAESEIAFLAEKMGMQHGNSVLDFGCGAGRHVVALAKSGYVAVGVDFSPSSIARAKEIGGITGATYVEADCRTVKLSRVFDFGLCLYDVVGSFPEDESNEKILSNLVAHIKPGGLIALSVMSFDFMNAIAKHKVTMADIQDALLDLPASDTMQTTGNIFDPDFVLLDTRARVSYDSSEFLN